MPRFLLLFHFLLNVRCSACLSCASVMLQDRGQMHLTSLALSRAVLFPQVLFRSAMRYKSVIARWLGRRLPKYSDRVNELCEQLLEEMPVEHLKSRTFLAESTIGLVHVLRFTKYLKLGASHLEPYY